MIEIGKHLKALLIPAAFCLLAALCACDHSEEGQTAPESPAVVQTPEDKESLVEADEGEESLREFTGVLDGPGIRQLDRFPNLRRVDLSGSEDYEAILQYGREHPEVELRYTVELGGCTAPGDSRELSLEEGCYSLELLQERLRYLPALESLHLEGVDCEKEQLERLLASYPETEIHWTVRILDRFWPEDTRELDLVMLEPEQAAETARTLRLLPELACVQLSGAKGENRLGLKELRQLQEENPETLFRYRFSLFGQDVSTEDESVSLVRVPIGSEGQEELRLALQCLTSCSRCLLDDCGLENDFLAALREELPQRNIVWRIHIEYMSLLTDVKIIHLTFLLTDENARVLRYCRDVEYLDLGHNSIADISFTASMPHLRYLILSFTRVSDLEPLAKCRELEMLELFQCRSLRDLGPLAACTGLKLLNVSDTGVEELSPLYGLSGLERLHCIGNKKIPQNQQERLRELLPDCWISFQLDIHNKYGWSYDGEEEQAAWYREMSRILHYREEPWFFGDYPENWNREERRFE